MTNNEKPTMILSVFNRFISDNCDLSEKRKSFLEVFLRTHIEQYFSGIMNDELDKENKMTELEAIQYILNKKSENCGFGDYIFFVDNIAIYDTKTEGIFLPKGVNSDEMAPEERIAMLSFIDAYTNLVKENKMENVDWLTTVYINMAKKNETMFHGILI